jgi:hypothetical protein
MKTIMLLKAEDHAVISNLINIYEGKTSSVDYSTTIFESLKTYNKTMNSIEGNIIGSQIKNLVNTRLVAERGNENKTYFSHPDKGVGFGYIFIDYIKKNPLLVLVVDKDGSDYKYSSCGYDKESASWIDKTTTTINASNIKELLDAVIEKLSEDVLSFTE